MLDDRDHPIEAAQELSTPGVAPPEGPSPEVESPSGSEVAPGEPAAAEPPGGSARPEREQLPTPPAWVALLMALGVLGLSGFSLALGLASFFIARRQPAFFGGNTLGAVERSHLLLAQGIGLVLPLLSAGAYALRRRAAAGPRLVRLAKLLCPLLLAGLVPGLYVWEFGQRSTLQYLFFLVLMVFASQYLLRISFGEWSRVTGPRWLARSLAAVGEFGRRRAKWLGLGSVLVAAAAYAAYTGYFSIHQHRVIQTFALDLGIYDNLMYGALSGKPFRSPVLFGPGNHNYLSGHAEYGMLLFLPIYALRPGAETLLLLQSVMLGFAAVPLYLFARTKLSTSLAVLVSFCYLLFAPLHGPNFYDFHWLPLAIFFHFWLYFALATRRNWLAIPLIFILLSMREDIAMGLCVLGAFLFLTGERVRFGLILSLGSVLWFALNKFVLMRLAGHWWFENMYSELFADGQPGYGSVLKTLLSNPTFSLATLAREPKLVYIFHLLAPLAFLPARRLPLVGLLLPGFFFTLLTTGYWPTTSIAFQYTTHWIPYLFLATVLSLWLYGSEADGKLKRAAAAVTLALVLTSHSYNFGAILQRESFVGGFLSVNFKTSPEQAARYAALSSLIAKIPKSASVAATECLNPHISAREVAYTFRYEVPAVDYVLVSKLEVSGDTSRLLRNLLRRADYGLVGKAYDEFYLFKRGAPPGEVAGALASLGIRLTPRERKRR